MPYIVEVSTLDTAERVSAVEAASSAEGAEMPV
jgi:hypothetical protein